MLIDRGSEQGAEPGVALRRLSRSAQGDAARSDRRRDRGDAGASLSVVRIISAHDTVLSGDYVAIRK